MMIYVNMPKYVAAEPVARFSSFTGVVAVKPVAPKTVTINQDQLFEIGLRQAAVQIQKVTTEAEARSAFANLFSEVK